MLFQVHIRNSLVPSVERKPVCRTSGSNGMKTAGAKTCGIL